MKKLKLLPCAIILAVFMFSLSAFNNSKEIKLTTEPVPETIEDQKPIEALIIWKKGTKESDKQDYRDFYIDNHILLSWYKCEDPDKETWEINCDHPDYQCKDQNSDPDPEPVDEKKPKTCCMAKTIYNANCKDY